MNDENNFSWTHACHKCSVALITTLPLLPVELPKTTHVSPLGKEYLCFRVDKKSPHAAQCVK